VSPRLARSSRQDAGGGTLTDLVGHLERSERQLTTIDERYAAEYAELSDASLRAQLARLRLSLLRSRDDPETRARIASARDELHRRAVMCGRAAALDPPTHLAHLGDRPEGPVQRARWERGASAIEAYRLEYGIEHPVNPLGDRPENPLQLVAWQNTRRAIERQRDVGRDGSPV
jgi:hypothetical protein